MGLKSKIDELRKISSGKKNDNTTSISNPGLNIPEYQSKIDFRGQYSIEIKEQLEKFLFNAYNNNIGEVSIVHGKGTGKLRTEVHRLLKENSYVESYRLGNWNEGDSGVTLVKIKYIN